MRNTSSRLRRRIAPGMPTSASSSCGAIANRKLKPSGGSEFLEWNVQRCTSGLPMNAKYE